MAGLKRRGRKPGKKSQKKLAATLKKGPKELECEQGCGNVVTVDGTIGSVICPDCVQKLILPPPKPKPALTEAERKLKAERKLERAKKKAAKAAGIKYVSTKDLGFTRGWHLKKFFETSVDGKTRVFSFGKEISKKKADQLRKEAQKAQAAQEQKEATAFGRGWHFKAKYIGPNGEIYEKGVKTSDGNPKASDDELLAELTILMEQNTNGKAKKNGKN